MSAQLVPYDSLNAFQREQVEAIEIHAEQIKFSGDIHGALHTLLSRPGPGVKGFALLAEDIPAEALQSKDDKLSVPPLIGALLKSKGCQIGNTCINHYASGWYFVVKVFAFQIETILFRAIENLFQGNNAEHVPRCFFV